MKDVFNTLGEIVREPAGTRSGLIAFGASLVSGLGNAAAGNTSLLFNLALSIVLGLGAKTFVSRSRLRRISQALQKGQQKRQEKIR